MTNRFAAINTRMARPTLNLCAAAALVAVLELTARAAPSVYPTGTTIFDPSKTWSGYTVFVLPETGAVLIDMNGNEVRRWDQFTGLAGGPVRMLPGGQVVGPVGPLRPHQEATALVQYDWANNEVWRFDHSEQVETKTGETIWAARAHHDWQRTDFPSGYYSPAFTPSGAPTRTLILAHTNRTVPSVSKRALEDDWLFELSPKGEKVWEWHASDHYDELGFSAEARAIMQEGKDFNAARGSVDMLHVNAATWLGPNRWYDAGDQRFDPDNVMISSREASFIAIVARDGRVVWRIGPDYRENDKTRAIGQIIGQHHPHLIPQGLPGAGDLLVFDNGGTSVYGYANPAAPDGIGAVRRHFSRVLELNPITLEKVWEYSLPGLESYRFFSHYVSAAQRLPNGNTMITEGSDGRVFEVTTDGEIVWEYVSPYFGTDAPNTNRVYRAYRVPYGWVPQLERPTERAVVPPPRGQFRIAPRE
jgi:Arylsulfotransferase (ASST)